MNGHQQEIESLDTQSDVRVDPVALPTAMPRILVVDDDEAAARLIRHHLIEAGFQVDTARDGVEGLTALHSRAYGVVVTDMLMPELSGLDLVEAARNIQPESSFVLVTGSPSIASAAQALESGVAFYLCKPLEREIVASVVLRAAEKWRQNVTTKRANELLNQVEKQAVERTNFGDRFDAACERIRMAFQPIIDVGAGRRCGYEALLRNDDPAFSNPAVMLEAAESLGKVVKIGRIVRSRVADALRDGRVDHVFVNLHADDLQDAQLGTNADPLTEFASRVTLELTERAKIEMTDEVIATIERLRASGFRIAIDDLGAGYASLAVVAVIAPDVVKLDMSLTRDIHRNVSKQKLVRVLVDYYRESGVEVVAEGIELSEELDFVTDLGCHMVQGYLTGRPAFIDAFAA